MKAAVGSFAVTFPAILEWASSNSRRKIQRLGKCAVCEEQAGSSKSQLLSTSFIACQLRGRGGREDTTSTYIERRDRPEKGGCIIVRRGGVVLHKEWRPDIDDRRLKTVLSFSDPMDLLWRTNDASYLASGLHSLCWLPAQKWSKAPLTIHKMVVVMRYL